jgi:hypothetical protein
MGAVVGLMMGADDTGLDVSCHWLDDGSSVLMLDDCLCVRSCVNWGCMDPCYVVDEDSVLVALCVALRLCRCCCFSALTLELVDYCVSLLSLLLC